MGNAASNNIFFLFCNLWMETYVLYVRIHDNSNNNSNNHNDNNGWKRDGLVCGHQYDGNNKHHNMLLKCVHRQLFWIRSGRSMFLFWISNKLVIQLCSGRYVGYNNKDFLFYIRTYRTEYLWIKHMFVCGTLGRNASTHKDQYNSGLKKYRNILDTCVSVCIPHNS